MSASNAPASARFLSGYRGTALAGFLFFVLFFLAGTFLGDSPHPHEPVQAVTTYIDAQHSGIQMFAGLTALAGMALLVWLVGVRNHLRHAGADELGLVCLVAGLLLVAQYALIGNTALGALAHRGDEVDQGFAYGVFQLWVIGASIVTIPAGLLAGAAGIASYRKQLFPRWFALASAPLVAIGLVAPFAWAESDFFSPDVIGVTAFVSLFPLWVLVASVLLWRAKPQPAPAHQADSRKVRTARTRR